MTLGYEAMSIQCQPHVQYSTQASGNGPKPIQVAPGMWGEYLNWINSVPHHTQDIKPGNDGLCEVYIL